MPRKYRQVQLSVNIHVSRHLLIPGDIRNRRCVRRPEVHTLPDKRGHHQKIAESYSCSWGGP